MTANAYEPGEEAGYWHTHSEIEELYVFLSGTGQMGLDDDIVDVGPGSVVRVGQGVWRTWRSLPDSPGQLRWLCIRAAGEQLGELVIVLRDQVEELHQHAGAALRVGRSPGRVRGFGGFNGEAHFSLRGQCNTAQNSAVHRLEIFGRAARCPGNMLAANEMSDFLHGIFLQCCGGIMRYKICIAMQ